MTSIGPGRASAIAVRSCCRSMTPPTGSVWPGPSDGHLRLMKPTPTGPEPSTPPPDAVEARAEELTAEEKQAGVGDPSALAGAVPTGSGAPPADRPRAAPGDRGAGGP